jgi:hypothetical protein
MSSVKLSPDGIRKSYPRPMQALLRMQREKSENKRGTMGPLLKRPMPILSLRAEPITYFILSFPSIKINHTINS